MIKFIRQLFCKHSYKLYHKDRISGSKFVCTKCKKTSILNHVDIVKAHENIIMDIKLRLALGEDIPTTDKHLKIDYVYSEYRLYGSALLESLAHWKKYGYDITELGEK